PILLFGFETTIQRRRCNKGSAASANQTRLPRCAPSLATCAPLKKGSCTYSLRRRDAIRQVFDTFGKCFSLGSERKRCEGKNRHYAIAGRRYLTNLRNIPINSVGVLSSPHPNAIYRDVAYFCWVLAIAGGVLLIFRRMSEVCYCPGSGAKGG